MNCKLPVLTAAWMLLGCGLAAAQPAVQRAGNAGASLPAERRPTAEAAAIGADRQLPPDGQQPPQSERRPPGNEAEALRAAALLAAARESLGRYPTVVARVRQQVDLYDQRLVGTGTYAQMIPAGDGGGGVKTRLALKLQVGPSVHSLLEVNDGNTLWRAEQGSAEQRVTSVDLARLRAASSPYRPTALAASGLEKLLHGLEASFAFDRVETGRLAQTPVYVLRGFWRGKDPQPEPVPHEAALLLGREDLFPYLIELTRREPNEKSRPMLRMELFEIRLGAAVDPREFAFRAGDADVIDETAMHLRRLDRGKVPATAAKGAARR